MLFEDEPASVCDNARALGSARRYQFGITHGYCEAVSWRGMFSGLRRYRGVDAWTWTCLGDRRVRLDLFEDRACSRLAASEVMEEGNCVGTPSDVLPVGVSNQTAFPFRVAGCAFDGSSSGLSLGATVGISVASAVATLLLAAAIFVARRPRRRGRRRRAPSSTANVVKVDDRPSARPSGDYSDTEMSDVVAV